MVARRPLNPVQPLSRCRDRGPLSSGTSEEFVAFALRSGVKAPRVTMDQRWRSAMWPTGVSPLEQRWRADDRRTGDERRASAERGTASGAAGDAHGPSTPLSSRGAGSGTPEWQSEPDSVPLGRLFQLPDGAAAAPAAAIAAHRCDLRARLARHVGLLVAGLAYLLNIISRDLVAPTEGDPNT